MGQAWHSALVETPLQVILRLPSARFDVAHGGADARGAFTLEKLLFGAEFPACLPEADALRGRLDQWHFCGTDGRRAADMQGLPNNI